MKKWGGMNSEPSIGSQTNPHTNKRFMNNSNNNQSGKHKQPYDISINNPEKVDKNYDWWDEICKSHGEVNYWPKNKPKRKDD